MQIQLKQPEIEEALRDYIVKQGINLSGRDVAITFTSGRKDNGISADMDISDIQYIPGFEGDEDTPTGPVKRASLEAVRVQAQPAHNPLPEAEAEPEPEPESEPEQETPKDEETPPSTKTTSLFGS